MACLASSFSGLSLGSVATRRGAVVAAPSGARPVGRVSFFVDAAQNSLRRQRVEERNRVYNKDRRSAVATNIKKVLAEVESLKKAEVSESDITKVESMIRDATVLIDKAVSKGMMKKNTAARRKSRIALAKQRLMIEKGLYTPAN